MTENASSGAANRHMNLGREYLQHESYDDYVDERVESFFEHAGISYVDHGWDFVIDAKNLYESGLFGELCRKLDRLPSRERFDELQHGDCVRCGEADVGAWGITKTVVAPDGEHITIHQHTRICEPCHEATVRDLEQYGEIQPSLEVFA